MNEVTRIHLGRQPFTISVDAHRELNAYLAAIEKQVHDEDVTNEVEMRMSELLTERGVTGEKVILPTDVDYLKEQLGSPNDFSDDQEEPETKKTDDKGSKRLFRDTDNALIAGIASGLANYFGIDTVLVRIIFVILTFFSAGLAILLYLALWLIVPPAETASEKLQMQGKSVTLGALKDSVSKADVPGAARRVNNVVLRFINGIFRLCVRLAGIGFILFSIGMVFWTAITVAYMLIHNGKLFQEDLFPVGAREHWLVALALASIIIIAVFLLLTGIAAFKRRWPVSAWITGVLAGVFLITSAASIVLTADAVPHVRDRYETGLHTTAIKNIPEFNKIDVQGIDVAYVSSPNYAVNVHYFGNPDLSKIKTRVTTDGTLYVDATALDTTKHCTMLCLFPKYDLSLQIYAPNIQNFKVPADSDISYPAPPVLN